jgi:GDP-L-fucose synthase|tara:strand:+ start:1994 stop:2929 length:936 start_codon:yes stop_codon:yes gene_type:complete
MLSKKSSIFVTGHKGLVGSAIVRRLIYQGYKNIITIDRNKLDLRDQKKVFNFFKKKKINAVINAAGYVGGIYANNIYKAKFIYDNLAIQNNIIHSCYTHKIKSLIFLGSSCIYPKNAKQPIKEKYLLTGELEKTNEPYAIAKIAGIKMCESYNFQYKTNYKCLMPCNLYGPNDNYDLKTSHFFPALIVKALVAKKNKKNKFVLWGSGKPKRELMYVDDLADACIYFLNKKIKDSLINIGTGYDKSIIEYAKFILKKINFKCKIILDKSKPDGTRRKIIDNSIALSYGWKPKVNLDEGFELTLKSYLSKFNK